MKSASKKGKKRVLVIANIATTKTNTWYVALIADLKLAITIEKKKSSVDLPRLSKLNKLLNRAKRRREELCQVTRPGIIGRPYLEDSYYPEIFKIADGRRCRR